MRIATLFLTGTTLLGGVLLGPALYAPPNLSQISATSVRVQSLVRKPVYSGGSSTGGGYTGSRWGRSSRYSSGGGYSFGK